MPSFFPFRNHRSSTQRRRSDPINAIALVFGLLFIFSCTFSLSLRKTQLAKPIERTYQANNRAFQKILNAYESDRYKRIKGKKSPSSEPSVEPDEKEERESGESEREIMNDCARLNLWPLIQGDKKEYPILYRTAGQIIENLYGEKITLPPKFEYALLDALLRAAKEELKKKPESTRLVMERFALTKEKNSPLHSIYYRMLKGTKKAPLEGSYPSLLEVFVLEREQSSLCLSHASPLLLEALFGKHASKSIINDLREGKISFDKGYLLALCQREENFLPSSEFLDLFSFHINHTQKNQKIFVRDEQDVCLKKKVFFAS